jgi:hypothetical protein
VRHLQRNVRLPGLRTAEQIKGAADALVEADWLHPPAAGSAFGQRGRIAYAINPRLWRTWSSVGRSAKIHRDSVAAPQMKQPDR